MTASGMCCPCEFSSSEILIFVDGWFIGIALLLVAEDAEELKRIKREGGGVEEPRRIIEDVLEELHQMGLF